MISMQQKRTVKEKGRKRGPGKRQRIGAGVKRYALLKVAQIKCRMEEYVSGMGHRSIDIDMNALLKDAKIKCRKEEYVSGMGRNRNDAAVKDVQIKPSMEESALGMGRNGRRKSVARKDAQIMLPKEEFAFDMERNKIDYAAMRGV